MLGHLVRQLSLTCLRTPSPSLPPSSPSAPPAPPLLSSSDASLAGDRNWAQEFQLILRDYFRLRGTIPKLLKDFETCAVAIGKRIISGNTIKISEHSCCLIAPHSSERNLSVSRKSIRPFGQLGEVGLAGGEKFLIGNIFFKYAVDLFGIYGGDHYAMVRSLSRAALLQVSRKQPGWS
jgi:hypothetical protein